MIPEHPVIAFAPVPAAPAPDRSGVCLASLDRDLVVVAANPEFLELSGRPAVEVYGRSLPALLPGTDQDRIRAGLTDVAQGRRRRFRSRVGGRGPAAALAGCGLTGIGIPGAAGRGSAAVVVLASPPAGLPETPDVPSLSQVEAQVLEGVAIGSSTAQIAAKLYLSQAGVEYHVGRLMQRFGLPNRAALVSRAYAVGLFAVGCWPPRVAAHLVK